MEVIQVGMVEHPFSELSLLPPHPQEGFLCPGQPSFLPLSQLSRPLRSEYCPFQNLLSVSCRAPALWESLSGWNTRVLSVNLSLSLSLSHTHTHTHTHTHAHTHTFISASLCPFFLSLIHLLILCLLINYIRP